MKQLEILNAPYSEFDLESLSGIAEKFLTIANQTANSKTAKTALSVYETARRLEKKLLKAKEQEEKIRDAKSFTLAFLGNIEDREKRSEVWRLYLMFCGKYGIEAFPKGELFKLLKEFNFKTSEIRGYATVVPPRFKDPDLIEARKLLE